MRTVFVLFSLLAIGLAQASPFVDPFNSFESDSGLELQPEFVPLEHQRPRETHHTAQAESKPFEVDVITTDVNGGNGGTSVSHLPGSIFRNRFPFFGNDFLNAFGVSGFDRAPEWWRGPNVCVERTEKPLNSTNDVEEFVVPELGNFHFTSNSCIERPNKYVCTQVIFENGKKKSLTVTRQCCAGYGRSRTAGYSEPCEKREIMTAEGAAEALGAKEFAALAKTANPNLLSSQKNITLFLPMDMPLATYRDQMQNENNIVTGTDDGEVENLVMRHIAVGELNLDEAANEQVLKTLDPEQTIRINAFPMGRSLAGEPFRYTANCVPIERPEKYTEQGLAYALNGVMKPVNKTLMDLIRERPDMSIITTVLDSTKLSKMLEGEKPMTIFAPTDKAFEQLDPSLSRVLREGKNCAANIIKNHMVDLSFCSVAAIPDATTTVINLLGEPLRFKHAKSQPVRVNNLANITESDIMGTNGVLHVLDAFLPTDSAMPLTTLMKRKNLTIFERLVEAAGMATILDDMQNATVFAPTDKALNQSKWSEMLEKTPEQLQDNAELKELINYHMVKPMIKTSDFVEKEYPTEAGSNVRVNLYSTHALFTNVMNRATVNCARVMHFDDESCGSVLHQVDKVLTPAKMTLLQQLENNPEYSHFLRLLRAANLTDRLNEASKDGFTLLVPKNDVFAELGDWEQRLMQNKAELENLVKTHIVNEVVCCAGIIPTQWPFVRYVEAMNGAHLRISRNQRPKIENAGITKCDNIASNGIIHEINDLVNVQQQQPQRRRPQPIDDLFFK